MPGLSESDVRAASAPLALRGPIGVGYPSPRGFPGGMPERPKGTVCKIVGYAYGGSNPPPPILFSTESGGVETPPLRYTGGPLRPMR